MKKLVVLMLVLAMASLANALMQSAPQTYYYAMDTSAPGAAFVTGDVVTVDIYAGDTVAVSSMLNTVLNISTASAIGSVTQGPSGWSAFGSSTASDGSGGYNVNVNGTIGAGGIAVDVLVYSVTFTAGAAGIVTIDATSGNWSGNAAVVGPLDAFNTGGTFLYASLPHDQITVIPEPATIALLSLGGLLLRRKK